MRISTKIIIYIIVVTLIGVAFYAYKNKSVVTQLTKESQTEEKKLVKESDALSVKVTYPIISGNTKATADANAFIANDIDKRILDFEKDAVDSKANSRIDLPADIKSTVTGSPATEEQNKRYAAIFMGMEWYLRGAAHPEHTIDTYVYDYEQGKLVAVSDMFKANSKYLETLSKLSREDLMAQSRTEDLGYVYQADMAVEGTQPTAQNFSRILPLKDGLVIYFNEYQVAPYSAGPQQVVIPYVKLKDIINPDGVLGMYLQ